jgi:CheY-like chemotaxis protein
LRLINDILDLSRIEAGKLPITLEPVDVAEVLAEIQETLEPIATRQGITIAVDPLPDVLPRVTVDRTRFAQILMNYGSNAIKYNRPGGSARFVVEPAPTGWIRVTVIDTGLGIPIERQGKLFQPFQRAGQEAGPIEGTGIGLAITKRLAELMDGSVGFHSVPDRGSAFWVQMPVHAADEVQAPVAAPPEPERSLRSAGARHLVLYVEDNPANVAFMRDLMSMVDDIDLVTVPTAELGVELARARQPQLVLMDINLPGMSGHDALRELQASPETAHIPVIALTAAASARDRQRGLEAGFYRYLTKPVKVDELTDAVEAVLSRSS